MEGGEYLREITIDEYGNSNMDVGMWKCISPPREGIKISSDQKQNNRERTYFRYDSELWFMKMSTKNVKGNIKT